MIGAYFDCSFGAAGDMLLASLIDAGVSIEYITSQLKKIDFGQEEFELEGEATLRCTINSYKLTVKCFVDGGGNGTKLRSGRTFAEIKDTIEASKLLDDDKSLALRIFSKLANAEALVHGKTVDRVHFHEVGALDAIVDIVGFAVAYNKLKIESSFVSALPVGSGHVETAHGTFPVPSPAVVNLLKEAKSPLAKQNYPFECLTPTGAAILCTVASKWGTIPAMNSIDAIGYGAGSMNPSDHPNVSRVLIGELAEEESGFLDNGTVKSEVVCVIEANIDDLAPDVISFCQTKLLEAGALDATVIPQTMKKGRSGHLLTALCYPADKSTFEQILFEESSTIGVRSYYVERQALKRRIVKVSLGKDDSIDCKIAFNGKGEIVNISPEYKDCVKHAQTFSVPLKDVYDQAIQACRKEVQSQN